MIIGTNLLAHKSSPSDILTWAPCLLCNAPINIEHDLYLKYFSGTPFSCKECAQEQDWWGFILKAIKAKHVPYSSLSTIGAVHTIFKLTLTPFTTHRIQFSDYGIPENALVLDVSYTPHDIPLLPLEVHSNQFSRSPIDNFITLYPAPLNNQHCEPVQITVSVLSVPYSDQNIVWRNLTNAFSSYYFKLYESCIIPANVAVEFALSKILTESLKKDVSNDKVKSFLNDAATYSHQLNVLLPTMIRSTGAKPLSDTIRGSLNRLRNFRNILAHEGAISPSLTSDNTAELICAALFGVHYIRYATTYLLNR